MRIWRFTGRVEWEPMRGTWLWQHTAAHKKCITRWIMTSTKGRCFAKDVMDCNVFTLNDILWLSQMTNMVNEWLCAHTMLTIQSKHRGLSSFTPYALLVMSMSERPPLWMETATTLACCWTGQYDDLRYQTSILKLTINQWLIECIKQWIFYGPHTDAYNLKLDLTIIILS